MPAKNHDESIDWHAAFYEAIQQELIDYSNVLQFEREYHLNDEPLRNRYKYPVIYACTSAGKYPSGRGDEKDE